MFSRREDLGLTDGEITFYDALAANESAVRAMRYEKLKTIAAELIAQVRKGVTIDWTLREGACAKFRVMVKRILNKYALPAGPSGRSHVDSAVADGAAVP